MIEHEEGGPDLSYKASYRWTREELIKGMTCHYRRRYPRWLKAVYNFFFALFPFFGIFFIVYGRDWGAGAFLLSTSACWWLRGPISRRYFGRGFDQRPDHDRWKTWEFSKDGIRSEMEGIGKSEASWNSLMTVGETGDGFLLYPIRNLFFWIPFASFEKPEGIEQVRRFLRENNVPIVRYR